MHGECTNCYIYNEMDVVDCVIVLHGIKADC